jgi:uncharacterized protein YjbI with pentapeptide repeats
MSSEPALIRRGAGQLSFKFRQKERLVVSEKPYKSVKHSPLNVLLRKARTLCSICFEPAGSLTADFELVGFQKVDFEPADFQTADFVPVSFPMADFEPADYCHSPCFGQSLYHYRPGTPRGRCSFPWKTIH